MDKEQEKQLVEECAVLLELTKEISVKYGIEIRLVMHTYGVGYVCDENNNAISKIGYKYPQKEKQL